MNRPSPDRPNPWAATDWLCVAAVALACGLWPDSGSGGERRTSKYFISTWQAEDGLPQHSVTCITQTRAGYLWFGTINGLVRFDGFRFQVFDSANTPELKSRRITALFEDADAPLWTGTEGGGVTVYWGGEFRTWTVREGLPHDVVQVIGEDGQGQVLIGTPAGLAGWRESKAAGSTIAPLAKDTAVTAIHRDTLGKVWVPQSGQSHAVKQNMI